MPYIITTTTPHGPVGDLSRMTRANAERALEWQRGSDNTRTAVATLEEVNAYAESIGADWRDLIPLDEDGGTIGPLPDGTVIEVRPMLRNDVTTTAGEDRYIAGMTAEDMVSAFNAA